MYAPAGNSEVKQAHIRGIALLAGFLVLSVVASLWLIRWSTGGSGVSVTSWSVEQSALSVGGARSSESEVPRPRTGLVATNDNRGLVLFGRYCDSCHPGAKQGSGPALNGPNFAATHKPEAIIQFVRNGGFAMPAFRPDFLADADLQEIAKYLIVSSGGTWTPPAVVPAAAAPAAAASGAAAAAAVSGEALYAKNCQACHPGGKAGMGPSVSSAQSKSAYSSDAQLSQLLRAGKGGMPAFKADRLSDADMSSLVKYVLALPVDK